MCLSSGFEQVKMAREGPGTRCQSYHILEARFMADVSIHVSQYFTFPLHNVIQYFEEHAVLRNNLILFKNIASVWD